MKRIALENKETKQTHFIGSWNIENDNLCKEIIHLFEENKNLQTTGITGLGKDSEVKKTTDITITPNDLKDIKFKCLNSHIKEF